MTARKKGDVEAIRKVSLKVLGTLCLTTHVYITLFKQGKRGKHFAIRKSHNFFFNMFYFSTFEELPSRTCLKYYSLAWILDWEAHTCGYTTLLCRGLISSLSVDICKS